MSEDKKEITLLANEYFKLDEQDPKSLFCGLNIFVRNNAYNIVKVVSDHESILISIEKSKK